VADNNTITNFVTHALGYKEMFIGIDFTLPFIHEGRISTVPCKLMEESQFNR